MKKIYSLFILTFFFGINIFSQNEVIFSSNGVLCEEICDGIIFIEVDEFQTNSEPPFDIQYTELNTGNSFIFEIEDYSGTIEGLCGGNYDIEVGLSESCDFTFTQSIPVIEYIPDYSRTYTAGNDASFRNVFFQLTNPIPNESVTFKLIRSLTGEVLCESQFNEISNTRNCPNLNSTEEYCAVFTRTNGCEYEDCFIVPGQNCLNELNISLVSSTDECREFSDGSLEVSVELNECTEYNIAWTSGGIGLVADYLKAGNYCVTAISKDCEDCRTVACFDVGSAPDGCEQNIPCEEILANEVLITTDFIFFNTSTNTCEGGSFNFDASGSSVYPVTISVSQQPGEGCIQNNSPIELTESNLISSYMVNCSDFNSSNCAGEYCFDIQRPGCPVTTFCRFIQFCQGKARNSKELACLYTGDGGQTGNNSGTENLEEIPSVEIGLDRGASIQTNSSSLLLAKIFPNPFITDINIQIENNNSQNVQIVLMDIYGRTVLSERQELTKGINMISLQPSVNLVSGIYALTIIDQQQKKYTQLITRVNN